MAHVVYTRIDRINAHMMQGTIEPSGPLASVMDNQLGMRLSLASSASGRTTCRSSSFVGASSFLSSGDGAPGGETRGGRVRPLFRTLPVRLPEANILKTLDGSPSGSTARQRLQNFLHRRLTEKSNAWTQCGSRICSPSMNTNLNMSYGWRTRFARPDRNQATSETSGFSASPITP